MDQEDPRVTNFMKQHDISPVQAIEIMGNYYDHPVDNWNKTSEEGVDLISLGFKLEERISISTSQKLPICTCNNIC